MKAQVQYRIQVNGKRRYFTTLDAANKTAEAIFRKTNVLVGIEAVQRPTHNASKRGHHTFVTTLRYYGKKHDFHQEVSYADTIREAEIDRKSAISYVKTNAFTLISLSTSTEG